MSKYLLTIAFVLLLVKPVLAANFESDITILEPDAIAKLSDENIQEVFLDATVELDASKTFHNTSGFTPKDYKEYKALVKFRLRLLLDMNRRNLEIPQFDRYNVN